MLKVYLIQMASIPGQKKRNLKHAAALVRNAAAKKGGIILFPEMFATGYLPHDTLGSAEVFKDSSGETASFLSDLANKTGCTVIGAGIAQKGRSLTNHSSVYIPGRETEFAGYDKMHPFLREQSTLKAGKKVTLFKTEGWRITPTICYDLRFPETYRAAVCRGIDLITVQAAWPKSRVTHFEALLRARAIENQCYVVAVNACGLDAGGNAYAGNSIVIDPEGNTVARAGEDETVVKAELDIKKVQTFRRRIPALKDAGFTV